jgi:hypothetical protein
MRYERKDYECTAIKPMLPNRARWVSPRARSNLQGFGGRLELYRFTAAAG